VRTRILFYLAENWKMKSTPHTHRKAFTLVELLVVIAIIGILIAMLLPAVQQVREAARRTDCLNNLRQVALATHMFNDSNGAFPPARTADPPKFDVSCAGPESWMVRILPYIEQNNLHALWDYTIDYDLQVAEAIDTPVGAFLCASRHSISDATVPTSETVFGGGG
jgi:prepilin-type N-terminal cleavage/methylation domain-containing protein